MTLAGWMSAELARAGSKYKRSYPARRDSRSISISAGLGAVHVESGQLETRARASGGRGSAGARGRAEARQS